jgi:hypothetical protein
LAFDDADYDAEGDVLYLHVGASQEAEGEETPEGHVLRFEPGTHRIVGLTVINARWLLDRDGRLTVTIPETVEASARRTRPRARRRLTGQHPGTPRAGLTHAWRSGTLVAGGRRHCCSSKAGASAGAAATPASPRKHQRVRGYQDAPVLVPSPYSCVSSAACRCSRGPLNQTRRT